MSCLLHQRPWHAEPESLQVQAVLSWPLKRLGSARTGQCNLEHAIIRGIGAAPALFIPQVPMNLEKSVAGSSREAP